MPAPRRPEILRGRVFLGRDAIARGCLTSAALRSSAWRRLFRGVYVDASLPRTHAVTIAGASLLLPPEAVFSGRSAAYLMGARELADGDAPVEVTVPPAARFGPVTGLRIRQAVLAPSDVRSVGRRRCTTGLRTALDIARLEPLPESVVALDVLLGRGLLTVEELAERVASLPAQRGSSRARRAVALADGRAESPQESRLRVVLTVAGLTPVPQFVVRDEHGFVARVDLAFPEQRVAIEYDGLWHAETAQFIRDRRRLNRLVAAGWTVMHVTAADLREPEELVARVRKLLVAREIGELGV